MQRSLSFSHSTQLSNNKQPRELPSRKEQQQCFANCSSAYVTLVANTNTSHTTTDGSGDVDDNGDGDEKDHGSRNCYSLAIVELAALSSRNIKPVAACSPPATALHCNNQTNRPHGPSARCNSYHSTSVENSPVVAATGAAFTYCLPTDTTTSSQTQNTSNPANANNVIKGFKIVPPLSVVTQPHTHRPRLSLTRDNRGPSLNRKLAKMSSQASHNASNEGEVSYLHLNFTTAKLETDLCMLFTDILSLFLDFDTRRLFRKTGLLILRSPP